MNEENPTLIIQFDGEGSAHFSVSVPDENHKISPMQLFAVSNYLEFKANTMLAEQEYRAAQQKAQQQIMVPKPKGIAIDTRQ